MSWFIPTTLLQVLRGSETDDYGDEADTDTVVVADVPAAITEDSQRRYLPVELRAGVVETYTIRMRPDVDVQEGDRLEDSTGGVVYQVRDVYRPHSVVGFGDVRVEAVRVGSVSQPVNG